MHSRPSTMTVIFAAVQLSTRVASRQSKATNLSHQLFRRGSSLRSLSTSSSSSSSSLNDDNKYFTIGLTGASGLIGTALRDEISNIGSINGKPVRCVALKRGSKADKKPLNDDSANTSLVWNPNGKTPEEVIDPSALQDMDAIVHLSGENISTGLSGPLAPLGIRPWTDAKKKEIIDSRVITTRALAQAIAKSEKKPSFLVAGGVGAYGPDFFEGAKAADESADISKSTGFLAEISRKWEGAAQEADDSGARVVKMRNGVVLSTKGGAMAKLYPIFLLGGGGIVGSGKQYFPFISARDMARAMIHVLQTPSLNGPVNMCAPSGCTNAEFTSAIGKVLRRPTILPFPSFAVSLLFGEMGEEILLGGTRAQPQKLLDSGFEFAHPTVEEAVQSAVDEDI
ncbi:unnamed protein product [Cylindrotheca closterium]|uniref:DUF1731 domain-containing protein n=1 Tax=Cylindrotheca closterium TaxID=2856 RepID=A0AAD2JHC0_9STRA|nr:unnamed protein product [Cylindrotheca closterium]